MSISASGEPDQMIISLGTRRASVIDDELTASFTLGRTILESVQTKSSREPLRPVRAVVEIVRHGGGLMPRALLGGAFTPGEDGADLLIEVQTSGEDYAGKPSCKSRLWTPLIPGLPDEFAHSVVDGFIRRPLPAGRIVVDRAAFDPVESSPMAFELAAELLAIVLHSSSMGRGVERSARAAIEAWP
ncbi:hypothetical protein OIT41_02570 [Arthrobacter sp. YA7-1]|uniref:hypothetical protein n=1 Tax=Arthrobacter sp. YA7-1 TaxID=2987701 RepID=UPI0022265B86|nr:hypothetical protein [Arthrobacter sp. YA7-1]UYY81980.1 hypothetical protein OIT41_02570 [Arthrobacter sp. YA7-1]